MSDRWEISMDINGLEISTVLKQNPDTISWIKRLKILIVI